VSDSGGTLESFLIPEARRGEYRYAYPTYVGRGETLAFSVYSEDKMESIVAQRDGERFVLSERSYLQNLPFVWSPSGHLLISVQDRGVEIDAVPVHPDTLRVLGPPSRFADDACCASVAADGTVVYATLERAPMGIAVFGPEGSVESALDGSFKELNNPSLSPDGGRVAVLDLRQDRAIWVHDLETARHTRLTFDRLGSVQFAWSPEGNSIVYSNDFEEGALFIARADGGSERERLDVGHLPVFFPHWSPQGDMIAFYVVDPETNRDIALLRLDGDRQAVTVLGTAADEAVPRISPSGRYLAYQSNESGRWEVYVTRLPGAKGRWQVSTDGGIHPRWSRDGGSLYYVSGDSLMQVQVETEPVLRTELPRVALEAAAFGTSFADGWECNYDTAPDGGFVIVTGAGQGKSTMVLAEGLL
jgi:Tol biopolymer transport system component